MPISPCSNIPFLQGVTEENHRHGTSWFAWQKEVLLTSTCSHKVRLPRLTETLAQCFFPMCLASRWILQATLQVMLLTKKVLRTIAFIQTSKIILFYGWLTRAVCLTKRRLHPHKRVYLQQLFKLLERTQWKREMAVQSLKSFKIPSALLQSLPSVISHSFRTIATLLNTIGVHC